MLTAVTANENEMEGKEKIKDISVDNKQPSVWTEVTGKTIDELKKQAKVNFDQLLGNAKEKSADKK